MKTATLAVLLVLFYSITIFGQEKARIVFYEHSLRWASENNFPYFLKLPDVDDQIRSGVVDRLKDFLKASEIEDHNIDYRVINGFGKAKISWPKKPDNTITEIAISSAISRDVNSFAIYWSMNIQGRKGAKVIFDKRVEHEIEPLSYSAYLTSQRWIEPDEFAEVFLALVSEALNLSEPMAHKIKVGSAERIQARIDNIIPVNTRFRLSIAGAMLRETNSTYELSRDTTLIEKIEYKKGMNSSFEKGAFSKQLFSEIFNSITGIKTYYNLKTKEVRGGRIISSVGTRKIRIDWLTETQSTPELLGEGEVQRIVSPITVQIYDENEPYGIFVYYKTINTNNEELSRKNFPLGGPKGTLGVSDIHYLTGNYRQRDFEIVYPEQEGLVIIYRANTPVAVLSMYNENPESRSFSGVKLSKNKTTAVSRSTAFLTQPEIDPKSAEIYSLFLATPLNETEARENLEMLMMLFSGISQSF